jgi:hypothetical protein
VVPLSPGEIDEINRAFLYLCALSEKHRHYLEGEGVPSEGCGSLAYKEATQIAKLLVEVYGAEKARRHPLLKEVTGKDGRRWWTIAGATDGLLLPALSVEGLVLGIQIRKDRPRGKNDRYLWLSHDGLGGTPLSVFKDQGVTPGAGAHLIITEGYKKAAIAAAAYHCHAISLAGVRAYRDSELIATIKALEVSTVSLAFDQDKRANPHVKAAEQRLLRMLAAALPGLELYYLNWDEEKGKGLDDALGAGAEISFEKAAPETGPRFVGDLPALALTTAFPDLKARPLYSVEEARSQHQALLRRLVGEPDGKRYVITSTTGTGKSQSADDAIAEVALQEESAFTALPTHRVLLLCPNKANLAERLSPTTKLGQAYRAGLVAVQRGRHLIADLTEQSRPFPPEACANPVAFDAGQARHAAAKFVCKDCPFGRAENWEKRYPGQPRLFKCEEEGYLAARQMSRKARMVVATKEAYLNNSRELGQFDLVMCDEELLPFLIESGIIINTEVLSGWREKLALKQIEAPSWQKLFSVIETALDGLSCKKAATNKPSTHLIPALTALSAAAAQAGLELSELVAECQEEATQTDMAEALRYEAYRFETPYQHNAKLVLPYRAATALLHALTQPDNPPYAVRQADGSYHLELFEVRGHLVELLQQKTVVVLDSTVPPQLKMLLPDLEEVCYEVAQHLHITQITNALYSKADLYNPATRALVGGGITAFVQSQRQGNDHGQAPGQGQDSYNHLAIVPMRFEAGNEAISLPNGSRVEHWGLHRATNQYQGCDTLTLVGHHLRPIDRIEAEVRAIRVWAGLVAPALTANRQLRLYNYLSPVTGKAAGRWMHAHPDTQVQAAITHDYTSHIIQAIGRLRAALRPDWLPKVRVLILCNEPVGDLSVDCLTTVKRLGVGYGYRPEPEPHYPTDQLQPEQAQVTYPHLNGNFSYNIYEETVVNGGAVPVSEVKAGDSDAWDNDLIQDETVISQRLGELEAYFAKDLELTGPENDPWEGVGDYPRRE